MFKLDLIDNQEIVDIEGNTVILNYAITQGKTYQISLNYEGDVTAATPLGQIRSNYAQVPENTLLATFSFLPMVYDSLIDKTTITAQLSAADTENIPYTIYQGTGKISTRTCYVFDMELHYPDGVVKELMPLGFVQIKPEVTRDV
jgi:hypothetical protein